MVDHSDERLVELVRHGQTEAFNVLVERYRQELFHYLARMTSHRSMADDIFQETFLQVHLSIDTFDTERRFRPWLFTIATNKARDQLRRNKRRDAVSLSNPLSGDQERPFLDLMEDQIPLPGETIQLQETQQLVRQTVEELPDHLREVLLLSYFQQFSYKEMAEILSIPIGTVKSRLHTAVGTFARRWKIKFNQQDHHDE